MGTQHWSRPLDRHGANGRTCVSEVEGKTSSTTHGSNILRDITGIHAKIARNDAGVTHKVNINNIATI